MSDMLPNAAELDYNIAYFTNTYLPFVGGVSNSVHLYAEYLRRGGVNVLIYAPTYSEQSEDTPGVRRIIAIPSAGSTEFSLPLPGSLKPMIDFAAQEFDLVHVHHPFLLGETGMRMARGEQLPLVFTYHTQYEQYTHNVPLNEETTAKALIKHASEFCEMCDLVIAPTEGIRALLRARGVTSRIEVLPSGIELARFLTADPRPVRAKLGLGADQPLLLHVGRLSREKNLEYLFNAVLIALEALPDAVFVVAGKGPDEDTLRALVSERGVAADRVCFLGPVIGDDLIALYAAADLFVFASTSETQGMVLVEAMAGATLVIALDADAMRDIVRDGENGRLLPDTATPAAYAEAIVASVSSRDDLARWSAAARETARAFDMPVLAARLHGHYRSLKALPRHRLKKETMTFGLIRNFLATLWDELAQ